MGALDDRRIKDRFRLEQQTLLAQTLVHTLENLLSNLALFQVSEVEDHGLIRAPAINQVDARKGRKRGYLSINTSSVSGSYSMKHCCHKWFRSITAKGNVGLHPLAEGW
jgi:hypothetical protein